MWRLERIRTCPRSLRSLRALFFNSSVQRKLSTRATFHYLEDRTEYKTTKPYHINLPERALPPGLQSNEVSIPYHGISVADIRDRQHNFKLDIHGFEVVVEDANDPSSLVNCIGYEDYADEALVRSKVREGVEAFLKRHISGCEDVVAFSHQARQVRRRDQQFPALPRGTDGRIPQPVQGVHIDMTPDGARSEIHESLLARGYSDISTRRWAVISTWRPLFGPLQDWPLAMMDYRSLDVFRDLIASDNIYLHKIRENYNVLWNKSHKWYFLENHQPNEVLVFKTFDTYAGKGNARACPHAAFRNPLGPENARPRESHECLSVVLFPEGSAEPNPYEEVDPRCSTICLIGMPNNIQPLPSETPPELLGQKLAEMRGGIE
ncbi:hypothetical protein BU26DRAFT_502835 [Trematosphaeria pertusa]|uniref:Uncharacterized protein n=1 Tax=Trematosphaeria pertusa TaxID=390896 RepID=A0A6A6IPA3_9PLEO|nr:uncharacterized protein BU26DRAFT_502835 [Trematosphaeria pertusa]KAF2252355.1 hypothetical protein BU26DRAFT_502835 [Trematosphaeria pertusa]